MYHNLCEHRVILSEQGSVSGHQNMLSGEQRSDVAIAWSEPVSLFLYFKPLSERQSVLLLQGKGPKYSMNLKIKKLLEEQTGL